MSWRKFQQNIKINIWIQRLKVTVAAVVVVLLLVRAYMFVDWMTQSPGVGESAAKFGFFGDVVWQDDDQINLFISPDWIVGVDVTEDELVYFQLEDQDQVQDLQITLKNNKILVDGYLDFQDGVESLDEVPGRLLVSFWRQDLGSNLSRWQIIKLWSGTRGGYTIQEKSDHKLPEGKIIEEVLKIRVLNGTTITGLALEASEWIENLGAKVIEVSNADDVTNITQIEVFHSENDADYRTIERLEQVFKTPATFVPVDQPMREDIRVTVGKDFMQ